jgi:iron-sulfur cluster assembly accessory protein
MTMTDVNVINLRPAQEFQPLLDLQESAASRLQGMMREKQLDGYGLRVFVSGGGCSGLQYGMTFDNEARDGDATWSAFGMNVMVDPISARYLSGAVISYQMDNMLAGAFKIDNPNAVSSCGCGHSFRTKDQGAASEDDGYGGGGCGSCGSH